MNLFLEWLRFQGTGRYKGVVLAVVCLWAWGSAIAHPGALNAEGCHNDRKAGTYHCRGAKTPPIQDTAPRSTLKDESGVYFKNCSAAKQAGAAPVRRGDPGYGKHLDRDGDGVGCEN